MSRTGFYPNRNLGQNFLINPSIASKIAAEIPGQGGVLEIGPGFGSLTEKLLMRSESLSVVEISGRMASFLQRRFSDERLSVIRADFLKVDPSELPGYPFMTVVGNLPYYISSSILFRMIEPGFRHVQKAVLMLQREVAIRLSTLDGGKDYGKLSLQIWPIFTIEDLIDVSAEDFYPVPRVLSRVVVLNRRSKPLIPEEMYGRFRRIVKVSFAMRRKTIFNNLKPLFGKDLTLEILEMSDVDPSLRAEQLPPERFIRMAEAMP
ncbi:MAG: ribosomal RNA small subunit methyltransferase A [Candidatus Aegiribacteria sp.]|nr:ribosomal RNA small subunit methyltransferase A [Candidatus Aegiribacteria sp.]